MQHSLPYAANCSMLFTEAPLQERPAAAAAAGFNAIEFWWPWPDQPVPGDREIDQFISAVRDSGMQLVGLNFFAGDLAGPDDHAHRGVQDPRAESRTRPGPGAGPGMSRAGGGDHLLPEEQRQRGNLYEWQ